MYSLWETAAASRSQRTAVLQRSIAEYQPFRFWSLPPAPCPSNKNLGPVSCVFAFLGKPHKWSHPQQPVAFTECSVSGFVVFLMAE